MKRPVKQDRDRATGRYAHTGDLDRLCVCGHPLAVHTAARVAGEQPCCWDDHWDDKAHEREFCPCVSFRLSRKRK